MMEATNFNISTVLEFTRSYDIDDEEPLAYYSECLLTHPDAIASNPDYQGKIQSVVKDMGFVAMSELLRDVLPKIDSCDYSRLQFVVKLAIDLSKVSFHDAF